MSDPHTYTEEQEAHKTFYLSTTSQEFSLSLKLSVQEKLDCVLRRAVGYQKPIVCATVESPNSLVCWPFEEYVLGLPKLVDTSLLNLHYLHLYQCDHKRRMKMH